MSPAQSNAAQSPGPQDSRARDRNLRPDQGSGGDRATDAKITAVVSLAHGFSHFSHLMVAPLFPWLREAFALSYAQLGLVISVFFVVSGVMQAVSGFLVDRVGALPVLLASLALFALAATGFALSPGYAMLLVSAGVAGLGNASFHPVDYSILNATIDPKRLGHAYAVHGIAGNLGWAAAPVFLVTLATNLGWRAAFGGAGVLAMAILLVVWMHRHLLDARPAQKKVSAGAASASSPAGGFDFLRIPAVWLSFLFFVTYAVALGGVQTFGPEAAKALHEVPVAWVAMCLTAFMLASAAGMVWGGFLVRDHGKADRVIGMGIGSAALIALVIATLDAPAWSVPVLFAMMGLGSGVSGPSRDLLVRAATPPGSTGRVYGMVYSGLDVGMAFAPALYGMLMDARRPDAVWIGIAVFQGLLILSVLKLGHTVRRRAAVGNVPA
jgi:MFS family permease